MRTDVRLKRLKIRDVENRFSTAQAAATDSVIVNLLARHALELLALDSLNIS